MKVAVIGGGLIGAERIEALQRLAATSGKIELVGVVDPNELVRAQVQLKYGLPVIASVDEILSNQLDWVFVCTPHDAAPEIARRALEAKTNVLIEKPLGRTLAECDAIIASRPAGCKLNVGFNYRFYAGIGAIVRDAKAGLFGELISVNMTLGHGNAPGMERSWKLDPVRCGGGCLIDPGVHLLDLVLQLANGNVVVEAARIWDGFWNTGIEEEAHMLLSDDAGVAFSLDVSLARWRSTFRLEVNGVDGYGIVEGRGRSYGPQSYRRGRRWGWRIGISQEGSEEVVVDRDPGIDSFLRETAIVLELPRNPTNSSLEPCGQEEGRRVIALLSRIQQVMK